ncbi:MAG: YciC family protein [Solirubrobacteraceae bacterium]
MGATIEVGAIIRRVFRIYVDEAPVLMPAAAAVFVVTGIVTELLFATGSGGLALLAEVIALVASTLFTGIVVELVADVQDGRRDASAIQLLRAVSPVFGQLLAVAILTGICEALGFVLVIVPGLFLMTIWAVVAPVVVVERPGGLRALGRSRELVRGHGWQVFGVILLLVIGIALLAGTIETVAGDAGTAVGIVVRVLVGVLSAPVSALAAAVLYFELLSRQPPSMREIYSAQ